MDLAGMNYNEERKITVNMRKQMEEFEKKLREKFGLVNYEDKERSQFDLWLDRDL